MILLLWHTPVGPGSQSPGPAVQKCESTAVCRFSNYFGCFTGKLCPPERPRKAAGGRGLKRFAWEASSIHVWKPDRQ